MTNTVIDQRYEVVRLLGGGGMAQVYLAKDLTTEQHVALKLINTEHLGKSRSLERFRREGRLLCSMHHPNLVRGLGVGSHEKRPYIAMEYIDGPSIAELIARRGRLTAEESLKLLLEIALALNHLFMQGAVHAHRDIKPTNILVDAGGVPKLTDFGIAKSVTEAESVTMTSSFLGSPHYMSPEQIMDPRTVDIRSDIYALGSVFYEMLTGEKAYPGRSTKEILDAHFELEPPQLEGEGPLTFECNRILSLTLAQDASNRFQVPRELIEAVAPLVSDVRISVPRMARGTLRLAAAMTALVIVSALMIGFVLTGEPAPRSDAQPLGGEPPNEDVRTTLATPTAAATGPVDAPTAGTVKPDRGAGQPIRGGATGWTDPDAQERRIQGQ